MLNDLSKEDILLIRLFGVLIYKDDELFKLSIIFSSGFLKLFLPFLPP